MKKYINKYVYTTLIIVVVAVSSCTTNDLDPTLNQQKEEKEAFQKVSDLESLLKGGYNRMSAAGYYGRDYLVTDEVRTPNVFSNGNSGRFTTQAAFEQLPSGIYIWDNAYGVIAVANAIIGVDATNLEGSQEQASHIQGQAYLMRAIAHFDLLKTYGQQYVGGDLGVPYIKEFKGSDDIPARESVSSNVEDIMSDLQTAFDLMDAGSFDSGLISSKEFMSEFTAKAFESRVAIQFGMWEVARDAAKMVIDSGEYSIIDGVDYVGSFDQDGTNNSIFEIAQSSTDYPGSDRIDFIYRGATYGDIEVLPLVEDLYQGDDVRADILGYEGEQLRNMGKFPNIPANIIIIRYEEVILNYAEALFELGDTAEAINWLNEVPEHRNADLYSSVTKENILLERRKEFIFEGLYYWDLLRNGMDIEKVSPLQNISETIPYGDYRLAYPIPLDELDANSNMEPNPGYGT